MKKILCISLLIMVVPVACMENDFLINFQCNSGFIAVKESNIQLIKTLHDHYQKHKQTVAIQGFVPLLANVSAYAVSLVNNALDVAPDKFGEHYNKLSAPDRTLLVKVSGQYDDDGNKTMLNIPELTKRLIEVCFSNHNMHTRIKKYNDNVSGSEQKFFERYQRNDNLRNTIKSYFKDDDEGYVRNYFKKKLICGKAPLMLKQPTFIYDDRDQNAQLTNIIYPGSLFLNGYYSNNQSVYNIPLYIGDTVYQTYGSCFVTDTRECRITDIQGEHCSLWVIQHDVPDSNVSAYIKLNGAIKGCCLSNTDGGVGYAVTYSEHDMVFSTIIMQKNGRPVIESVHVNTPNEGIIVDVCFYHGAKSQLLVATYEGLDSVIRPWAMDGKVLVETRFPFKEFAFLEKIFVSRNAIDDVLVVLFGVADQIAVYQYAIADTGHFTLDSWTSLHKCTDFWKYVYGIQVLKRGDSFFMYDLNYSPFAAQIATSEKKFETSGSFLGDLVNIFMSQPVSECYRLYSPDGQFLLCNSLKNKLGAFWVETLLKDAITHKQILSIDTLYRNFAGVGFTYNGELIFLNHTGTSDKVLLLNYEDKNCLLAIEDVAFQNVGTTSLLKRLCMACEEKGFISLCENDSTCIMLLDWAYKSPVLRKLLSQCLPLRVKKEAFL